MCAWAVWPSQIPKSQAQRRACLQATMMDHATGGRRQRRTTPKSRRTRSVRQHAGAAQPSAGAGAGAAQTRKTASCNAPPLLSLPPSPHTVPKRSHQCGSVPNVELFFTSRRGKTPKGSVQRRRERGEDREKPTPGPVMAYNAYASAGPPKPPGADQPVVIGSSVGLYGPAQGHWLREAGFMGEVPAP